MITPLLSACSFSHAQFIDLCILLGCDYLEPIKGVGPKTALKLIREHNGLAGVMEHLREKCALCTLCETCSLLVQGRGEEGRGGG